VSGCSFTNHNDNDNYNYNCNYNNNRFTAEAQRAQRILVDSSSHPAANAEEFQDLLGFSANPPRTLR
jgi:hypothetical protein